MAASCHIRSTPGRLPGTCTSHTGFLRIWLHLQKPFQVQLHQSLRSGCTPGQTTCLHDNNTCQCPGCIRAHEDRYTSLPHWDPPTSVLPSLVSNASKGRPLTHSTGVAMSWLTSLQHPSPYM